jgi:hypothetical protein
MMPGIGSIQALAACDEEVAMDWVLIALLAENDGTAMMLVLGGLAAVGGIACFFGWRSSTIRLRLIEDVPTSKVKGVAIGLTEVKGRVRCDAPLTSYLAECPCIYYRYDVEEHWQRTVTQPKGGSRTESGWKTVASEVKRRTFLLEDDTGAIRVTPVHAEVDAATVFDRTVNRANELYYSKGPQTSIANSTGKRRFKETAIQLDESIYVIGAARLREDVPLPEIGFDRDAGPFYISHRNEAEIVSGHRFQANAAAIGGPLLLVLAPPLLAGTVQSTVGDAVGETWVWMVAGPLTFCLAVLGSYAMLLYNGLVAVAQRMIKSWTLIDIQLQRRADLIPRLVEVVQAATRHEQGVQQLLAGLRTAPPAARRGLPNAAGVASRQQIADEQTAALGSMVAVVERYPELKTHQNFLALQRELADTEDRIMLARNFYNASVEVFNTRIQTLPDSLFASIAGYQPGAYYEIQEFQRRPVRVDFTIDSADDITVERSAAGEAEDNVLQG